MRVGSAPLFLIEKNGTGKLWMSRPGGMCMAKVTELTAQLAAPIAAEQGCSLWDVEYVREAGSWFLRVYIDKEGGVSIEDCEAVSRPLSDKLDELDPIEGS